MAIMINTRVVFNKTKRVVMVNTSIITQTNTVANSKLIKKMDLVSFSRLLLKLLMRVSSRMIRNAENAKSIILGIHMDGLRDS